MTDEQFNEMTSDERRVNAVQRLTIWEARQLILSEMHEYYAAQVEMKALGVTKLDRIHDLTRRVGEEANDIFGYINYFGLTLFTQALSAIGERNEKQLMILYSAMRVLEEMKPDWFHGRKKKNYKCFKNNLSSLRKYFLSLSITFQVFGSWRVEYEKMYIDIKS